MPIKAIRQRKFYKNDGYKNQIPAKIKKRPELTGSSDRF